MTQKNRIKPVRLEKKSEQIFPCAFQGEYSFDVPKKARAHYLKLEHLAERSISTRNPSYQRTGG
jgi:hypothetical protein